jgi:hypothetical protein
MNTKTPKMLKRLPIGIQTFSTISKENYAYVDKTDLIYELVNDTRHNFLSRPRRFGKSLLISTLKAYFQGRADLFKGLAIEKLEPSVEDGGWKKHEVIHFDFSLGNFADGDITVLHSLLNLTLEPLEQKYNIQHPDSNFSTRFKKLIVAAFTKTGLPVVILFDEYDKPLLERFEKTQTEGDKIHNELRAFFTVLKSADEYIRFSLLTGITKFAKLTLFSGANQLVDQSLEPKYSAICGITQNELESNFKNRITELGKANQLNYQQTLDKLRNEYDGYDFTGEKTKVYNPFSTLLVLNSKKFKDFWFESGTPTFLFKEIQRTGFDVLQFRDGLIENENDLEIYRPGGENIIPLLFQSGYLTIQGIDQISKAYILGFPNNEVRYGLLERMSQYFTDTYFKNGFSSSSFLRDLRKEDLSDFFDKLTAFFSAIPYDLQNKTEKHYQTVFYILFTLLGQYVKVEEHTAIGSADAVVELPEKIVIFEFKLDGAGTADDAIKQIEDQGYANKYEKNPSETRPILKIGVSFNNQKRTIQDWKIA